MSIVAENDILEAIIKNIEENLTEESQKYFDKVVTAGMRMALNAKPGTGDKSLLGRLNESKDVVDSCAKGAGALTLYMWQEHNYNFPPNIVPMVAVTLMCMALDTAEKAGIKKITNEDVGRGTKLLGDFILAKFNITPEKFKKVASRVNQITDDPTSMEMISRKSGMVKDPRASEPTDMAQPDVAQEGVEA